MSKRRPSLTQAQDILDRRHPLTARDEDQRAAIRQHLEVAELIYQVRTQAGLTQKALARLVGTTPSVISRLEDAEYDGHSMAMLRRIAAALGQRVEVRFVKDRRRDVA